VWNSDRDAIREAARANALQFGWDSSMEALFGRVYPAAFERRHSLVASGAVRYGLLSNGPAPAVRWALRHGHDGYFHILLIDL